MESTTTHDETDPFGFSEPPSKETVTKETNRVVEKIGKNKARALAALGIAAAEFLGISGKPDSYAGVGISLPDPTTGGEVTAGLAISSAEFGRNNNWGLLRSRRGFGGLGEEFRDVFRVIVGGASFRIYTARDWGRSESGGQLSEKGLPTFRIEVAQLSKRGYNFLKGTG